LFIIAFMYKKSISTHDKGLAGESRACSYLIDNGYQIIDRNFRIREGEIDIIAWQKVEKRCFLVFVEVKSLPGGDVDTLAVELNERKRQKIVKTAKCYLKKHREYSNEYIRFDVLALDVPGLEPVHHIINAFVE